MGYEQKPGMTGNISAGGQYDNFDQADSLQYPNIAAEAAANAKLSADSAAASATSASASANAAAASESSVAANAALAVTSAANAAISENNAAVSANTALTSATVATTQAGIATDKALEADASATAAANSATSASTSASTATTQAGIATTQAGIATTKASEASTSAANALTSANNASTSASNALTSANNAATSASNAATSETNSSASATTATTQAGIATTKASEAATSAANALTSANNADTSEANALSYSSSSQSSANAAANSALNAANSATAAAASAAEAAATLANKLDKNNNLSELTNVATARTNLGLGTSATLNAGTALGVATLDAGGTVPLSQIPASIQGGVSYQGTWNASTNTPTLTSSVGSKGHYYVVSVAGNTTLNGVSEWKVNDWAIFNGSAWEKIDNTDLVTSVNGYTGTVSLTYTDVGGASAAQGTLADTAVQPNTTPTLTGVQFTGTTTGGGLATWNDTDGTLDLTLKGGNVTLQVGQEQVIRLYNNTGSTLTDMQVVKVTGAQGNKLTVGLALADSDLNSATSIAVVTESIVNTAEGFATTSGLVRNVNTSSFAEGAALWLSPTVPGGITTTKPTAPNHLVLVGWCVRSHATVGSIFVHIQNGYELDELHDVLITSVTTNDFLVRNSSNVWVNQAPATARTSLGLGTAATTDSSAYATAAQGDKADTSVQQTNVTGSADIPAGTTAERDGTPQAGYFRFNSTLGQFEGYNGTVWGSIGGGGGATGGGSDAIFIENDQTVTANYTIPATKNAMSTGPVAVNSGVTITVSSGARWVVI